MGINGKKKGNAAELAIVHEFSERFNDHFQRVPQSGAITGGFNRAKVHNLRQDAQEILSGDIICPEWFPFSIESKCYNEKGAPKIYSILEGPDKVLDKWLDQAKGDAKFANKEYLLYIKITHRSTYIVIDYDKFINMLISHNILTTPLYFTRYNDAIILDKNDFLDNYIDLFLPENKKNLKKVKDINNIEVPANVEETPKPE